MNSPPKSPLLSEGYIHLKSVISEITANAARKHLINTYKNEHFSFIEKGIFQEYTSAEPWPHNPDVLNRILKALPNISIFDACTCYGSVRVEDRLHSSILNLVLNQNELIEQLKPIFDFESELFCHLAPAVRVIYPGNIVAVVPNHIDAGYNSHIHLKNKKKNDLINHLPFVTAWIPLQGFSSLHGGLRLYPRTFIESTVLNDHTKSLWIPPQQSSNANSIVPDYSIGDCIIFHPRLLHGSSPNLAHPNKNKLLDTSVRVSVDIRIFSKHSSTTKHYMSLLTGECYAPGEGPCALY